MKPQEQEQSSASSPIRRRTNYERNLVARAKELALGFSDLEFVFDEFPFVRRWLLDERTPLLVIGNVYSYAPGRALKEIRLGLRRVIYAMPWPAGGVVKTCCEVEGKGYPRLSSFLFCDDEGLCSLAPEEYRTIAEAME